MNDIIRLPSLEENMIKSIRQRDFSNYIVREIFFRIINAHCTVLWTIVKGIFKKAYMESESRAKKRGGKTKKCNYLLNEAEAHHTTWRNFFFCDLVNMAAHPFLF